MRTRAMLTACVAMLAAAAAGAADVAPPPRAVDDLWLPQPKPREPKDKDEPVADIPPSLFPNLVFVRPRWDNDDSPGDYQSKHDAAWRNSCPRLFGKVDVGAADGPQQRLLKMRLQQATREYRIHNRAVAMTGPPPPFTPPFECLADLRATALELWAGRPQDLVPWLEDLVIAAKDEERITRLRVEAGAVKPQHLNYATRLRLKVETDLWKARNAGAQPGPAASVKKGGAKEPPGGDWLAAKEPPSLFPDVTLPPLDRDDPKWAEKRQAQFTERCPRLSGKTGLTIEARDDTLQRLLKARLQQGALEVKQYREAKTGPGDNDFSARAECVSDTLMTAAELFAGRPKELIPWLEELLIEAKEYERMTRLRVDAGAMPPTRLLQASRHRLKVEAELWKAKNPK